MIYQHEVRYQPRAGRAYVAAQMTDLLQTAVTTGTGRAAQIGRPVAGKTGTTTSNKDGWFVGFSSGLTTGVWMGRDDAKVVPGLQGGTAPARAFSTSWSRRWPSARSSSSTTRGDAARMSARARRESGYSDARQRPVRRSRTAIRCPKTSSRAATAPRQAQPPMARTSSSTRTGSTG